MNTISIPKMSESSAGGLMYNVIKVAITPIMSEARTEIRPLGTLMLGKTILLTIRNPAIMKMILEYGLVNVIAAEEENIAAAGIGRPSKNSLTP